MNDISLIKNWHEKAKEDYFSRYTFEYLAFEAFLKKYKYDEKDIINISGNKNERSYIQRMKNDAYYPLAWVILVNRNRELNRLINELIVILKESPITTGSNWWNCLDYNVRNTQIEHSTGIIKNTNDFINIIEFWYQVRNNFFHANKDPDNERDSKLVMYAQQTLGIFIEEILLREIEEKTFLPAMWEDFEHRFFKGEAEVVDGRGGAANVYELLFLNNSEYPIVFGNKKIEKDYIIEKIKFNLINTIDDISRLEKEWNKVKRGFTNKDELISYFEDIIPLIKDTLGDNSLNL